MKAYKLADYINEFYSGSKTEFGNANGVSRQQVNNWLVVNYYVIDNKLVSFRRDLKEPNNFK